ncbi:exosortase A [Desulfuromonas thiophila]|uniref:exosortase A n=1 Tax=Desulfuromonas thiophila TaxID=57664 RepID=UPI0024A9BAE0|nr:exosortase A [Desulfuromonas thiophila]
MNRDAAKGWREVLWRDRWHLLVLLALLVGLYGRIVPAMVADWLHDPNYSHGLLVPLMAGYFAWQRWPRLALEPVRPDSIGLLLVLAALLLLVFGRAATEYFTMRVSLILLLAGILWFWYGRSLLRLLALPLGFLLLMVPLPYILYDAVAFPLKLLVARFSVLVLKLLGIAVLREGNLIQFPQLVLEVADACSGLRSLMSLLALAVAYAFISQTAPLKRLLIILAAVPIAIITNMFRVVVTGVLAQRYGAAVAEGFFHEFAGLAVFVLALLLLFFLGALLRRWRLS